MLFAPLDPLEINLNRSRGLATAMALMAIVFIMATVSLNTLFPIKLTTIVLLSVAFWRLIKRYSWREHSKSIIKLFYNPNLKKWYLYPTKGSNIIADLEPNTFISKYLLILIFKRTSNSKAMTVFVTKSCVSKKSWSHLRFYLFCLRHLQCL